MKPGMRMMMMDKLRQGGEPRSEYGGGNDRRMIGYDRNMPMPDRERTHPPMGGMPGREWEWPPNMYGYDGDVSFSGYGTPEARRRRDSRGRYMMGGMERDDDDDDKYHLKSNDGRMITGATWSKGMIPEKVEEHKAMEWVRDMRNPDGSTGPHFKQEMSEQLRAAHCPKCDKWEFMVALNMMYADYSEVAKKFSADKPEFYACMAKAFLEDPDAGEGKLAKYMEVIPA